MKFIITLMLLFFYLPTQAQIEDLIKNDSITWIAEWEADYLIDNYKEVDTIENNRLSMVKYLNKNVLGGWGSPEGFFSYCLRKSVDADKTEVFLDKDFKQPVKTGGAFYGTEAKEQLRQTLGIDEIDSKVYKSGCFIPYPYQPDDIKLYRAHQIMYYNMPKAQFQIRILAIAPLVDMYFDADETRRLAPLFWFKPEMSKPNLSSDDIVWAQYISTRGNSLIVDKSKILKNTMGDTLLNHYMQSFENQLDIPFWQIDRETDMLKKMNGLERKKSFNPTDTFSVINPKSYQVEQYFQQTHYTSQDIESLRFYQEWFWDDRQNKLFIYLKMVAPIIYEKNEAGEKLFNKAWFFRKTDD